jgi:glutathione S-transferase
MSIPILYTFRRCPFAIRARLSLAFLGVNYEWREVLLRDKPQELLQVSPKGTVPVLILENGTVLEESLDIMLWAYKYKPTNKLHTYSSFQADLIKKNDTDFKPQLDRFKYPERYEENTTKSEVAVNEWYAHLNTLLNPYLEGAFLSLADFALFPFIRQAANVKRETFNRLPYTRLHSWLQIFEKSSLFEAIMPKLTPWKASDIPIEHHTVNTYPHLSL